MELYLREKKEAILLDKQKSIQGDTDAELATNLENV
jgi:hypothetical protein